MHFKRNEETKKELEVLDLNGDEEYVRQSGTDELTYLEEKRLNSIIQSEERKAVQTVDKINETKKNIKEFIIKTVNHKNFRTCLMLVLLVLFSIFGAIFSYVVNQEDKEQSITVNSVGTLLKIDMNEETHKLDYSFGTLAVKSKDNYIGLDYSSWIKNSIDTDSKSYLIGSKEYTISTKTKLDKFCLSNNYNHIIFSNEEQTASKELVFSKDISNLSVLDVPMITNRIFEKSNPISVKTYLYSYDNSVLYMGETLGGGELNIKNLRNEVLDMEGTAKLSKESDGITIQLYKVGVIKIENIGANKVEYNKSNDVVIVKNEDTDEHLLMIFDLENEAIGCKVDDFVETTQDGLFIHKQFNEEGQYNRVFAVLKDGKLYALKANSESVFNTVCTGLGFDVTNLSIKVIQPVVDGITEEVTESTEAESDMIEENNNSAENLDGNIE